MKYDKLEASFPGLDEWLADAELILALAEEERNRRKVLMQFYEMGMGVTVH